MTNLQQISNTELVGLLRHYNLYATSTGGDKSSLVVPGPKMLEEIRRRLLATEPVKPPVVYPPPTPNKLDII